MRWWSTLFGMLRNRRWAYVEANDVQLPDEYDQIVSPLPGWIAIAAR